MRNKSSSKEVKFRCFKITIQFKIRSSFRSCVKSNMLFKQNKKKKQKKTIYLPLIRVIDLFTFSIQLIFFKCETATS
jgi:hypothetical protein